MKKLTDQELIEELLYRFSEKKRLLEEQKKLTLQLKDVNKKLSSSESLKSHFLSNIRNEINNPLSAILGLASNLKNSKNNSTEKNRLTADLIYEEAFNLNFQLKNIFFAADLEAGKVLLQYRACNIEELVSDIFLNLELFAKKKEITLAFQNNGEKSLFPMDHEKTSLILSNLISNSIKFSNSGSNVKVEINQTKGSLTIKIMDQGIGIDEENFKLVYDRFAQLDSGTTKSYPGQGLGLSITKSVLDLMNGTISIDSERGIGSTFTIEFPKPSDKLLENTSKEDSEDFLFDIDESF